MHIVTKSARKATRLVCGGDKALQAKATRAHRAHRRKVNEDLNVLVDEINSGAVDVEAVYFDNIPQRNHTVTKYDIA